ncbi:arginase [Nemania sp. NC0429]|nr:arginase [Nemania sp. NC0429]
MKPEVPRLLALLGASQVRAHWQFPHAPGSTAAQRPLGGLPDNDVDILYGSQFSGLTTYARIPYVNCLADEGGDGGEGANGKYDIAILGAPFDTGVTARPGARFGPRGIRAGSQGKYADGAWSVYTGSVGRSVVGKNALKSWATVVDCGDVPLTYLDNNYALAQLTKGHKVVSGRKSANKTYAATPRIIMLGGDHTTTLPALRSVHKHWGQVSVIHFDSHIGAPAQPSLAIRLSLFYDLRRVTGAVAYQTMRKSTGRGHPSIHLSVYRHENCEAHMLIMTIIPSGLNHGTFLHIAHEEGLIRNTSIHAGIRGPLVRPRGDIRNDERCGFARLTARDLDLFGVAGVVSQIRNRVSAGPVYISVDIDVLDPAFAPATGTPEPGGWSTRELLAILDGLSGLEVVGADVVEVAPAYDTRGETTALAAAEVVWSLLELMVETPVKSKSGLLA